MNKAEQMGVSRTRPSGHTVRTVPQGSAIDAIRDLVDSHSYGIVNGVAIDAYSASVVIAIYDGVNEVNKRKLSDMPVRRMIDVAFATLKRVRGQ